MQAARTGPGGAASGGDSFAGYPPSVSERLLGLRGLFIASVAELEGVGELTEMLKWGEPAYLMTKPRPGNTIRLGWNASAPDQYACYFNRNTRLVD